MNDIGVFGIVTTVTIVEFIIVGCIFFDCRWIVICENVFDVKIDIYWVAQVFCWVKACVGFHISWSHSPDSCNDIVFDKCKSGETPFIGVNDVNPESWTQLSRNI